MKNLCHTFRYLIVQSFLLLIQKSLKNPVQKLHKHVKFILIPTEHSMLHDRFIDVQFFGVDNLNYRNHIINKLHKVYVQSDYVKK